MNSDMYGQFWQRCQGNTLEKRIVISSNGAGAIRYYYGKKWHINPFFTLDTKMDHKFNVKLKNFWKKL